MSSPLEAGAPACAGAGDGVHPVVWDDGVVVMIDQRLLPTQEVYVRYDTWQGVADAICTMACAVLPRSGWRPRWAWRWRRAPRWPRAAATPRSSGPRSKLHPKAYSRRARLPITFPGHSKRWSASGATARSLLRLWFRRWWQRAIQIYEDDLASCRAIGEYGADLIQGERLVILTHCNAGALATAGYGTALGVIRSVYARNPHMRVMADETRPLLQGARLTSWELCKDGIPVELITDNMAGYFMRQGAITHVVVGADRITANGDVANKIGTYTVSVLAKEHGIPFYVAAPFSTVDRSLADGSLIPIEERAACEVTGFGDVCWAPTEVKVRNPAFDVTPSSNVTAIITDRGVAFPPYEDSLKILEAT